MFKRNKYDYHFRLQCVEAVIKKRQTINEVAKKRGFNENNLRLWILFYEHYGKDGLMARAKQNYSVSFKQEVLVTIDKEYLSLRSACIRFNIPSESIIINWRKSFERYGIKGLIAKPKGRPSKVKLPKKRSQRKSNKPLTKEEELLRENEYLKAENELLKKLHALVQAEQKQKP